MACAADGIKPKRQTSRSGKRKRRREAGVSLRFFATLKALGAQALDPGSACVINCPG
jgi:hypothetical protein